jgi:hypothetical protein
MSHGASGGRALAPARTTRYALAYMRSLIRAW